MPRRRRSLHVAPAAHVTTRGNRKSALFHDPADRIAYLRFMREGVCTSGVRLLAYCLMDNHVHLVMECAHAELSTFMWYVNGTYARYFNARYGTVGHVHQGPYHVSPILSADDLRAVAEYVAMNPVKAGLCAVPTDFWWSSARFANGAAVPRWLDHARMVEWLGEDYGAAWSRRC